MYSRGLEIYSHSQYSLYLQGTWNKEHAMWSHNNSPIKDTTQITYNRPCTKVSVIRRVHCSCFRFSPPHSQLSSDLEVTTCHMSQSVATRIEYDSDGHIKSQTSCAREVSQMMCIQLSNVILFVVLSRLGQLSPFVISSTPFL